MYMCWTCAPLGLRRGAVNRRRYKECCPTCPVVAIPLRLTSALYATITNHNKKTQ